MKPKNKTWSFDKARNVLIIKGKRKIGGRLKDDTTSKLITCVRGEQSCLMTTKSHILLNK